ncbi:MAG: ABC transporter ATP-binding protein [Chloroflexia bacterium]|nr:ABC transporter ATP-binding protein [Chloroflexia bacterium]
MEATTIALSVEQVSKRFRKKNGKKNGRRNGSNGGDPHTILAVKGVSLQVRCGEIFGILGANGSGKSTLIRLISTLLLPDQGRITVFGHELPDEEMQVKRLINRVSVDASFFKKLSSMENLIYAARLYGVPARPAREKAIEILEQLGVSRERVYEPLENLSRGMQQKVAIARAFLTQPVLLLLDEPTTGLDPRSKREVQDFVLRLRDEHDATILLTTHDMEEADRLCERIALIDQGRIVALDTPAGLKARVGQEQGRDGDGVTLNDVFFALTGRTLHDDEEEP